MRILLILSAILLLICASCSLDTPNDEKDESFFLLFPEIPMNVDISISMDDQNPMNDKVIMHAIFFNVTNNSGSTFHYVPDSGGFIYYYDTDQKIWQDVNDMMEYHPPNPQITLSPDKDHGGGQFPPVRSIIFTPNLPNLTSNIVLRFVVIGTLVDPGGDESPAGAYADVVISP